MHMKLLNLAVFTTVKNKKQVKSSIISEWLWLINLMDYAQVINIQNM